MPTAPAAAHALRSLLEAGTLAGLDDAALLARCASRDPARAHPAFAALVDRHAPMVLRACRAALADPHDADDAAQATFLVLARRAHKVRRGDALACWLYGVARRVAARARADRDRRRRLEARGAAMAAARRDAQAPADPCPELFEELDRLPPRYKAPLILCHLEGRSVADAAAALGCPPRTLQTRLTRARARLRDRLTRRGLAPTALLVTAFALPDAAWADATARAAAAYTADPLAAGLATAAALSQAQGALRTMFLLKLKLLTLAGLLAGAATLGVVAQIPAAPTLAPLVAPAQEAPKGETFAVRVFDAETGKPLPGARLAASYDRRTERLSADGSGAATIDLSRRRLKDYFAVDVWADGYIQQRFSFSTTDPRHPKPVDKLDVRLLPGEETLGGTVLDEEGRPVVGATVTAWGHLGEKKQPREMASRVDARTDDQGRWRIGGFRKMLWVSLRIAHPDFVVDDHQHSRYFGHANKPVDPRAMDPLRNFSDVQVLSRGVEVKGRVVDDRGAPLPSASVAWVDEFNRNSRDDELPWQTVDAEGRYRFPHARAEPLILIAKAPGRAPNLAQVAAGRGPATADIRLDAAKVIEGRVVDPQGRPIAGAMVSVDKWRDTGLLGVMLATEADGRFRWPDAPSDVVTVSVHASGRTAVSWRDVRAGDDIAFTLKRALEISGTMKDANTGKRIDEAKIEIAAVEPGQARPFWRTADAFEDRAANTIPVFASHGELRATLEAEKPAMFRIRLKAKGYGPYFSREVRTEEVAAVVDARLTPMMGEAVPLSGVVLTPDGLPADGATVAILDGQPVFSVTDGRIIPGAFLKTWTTAADGRFLIPGSMRPEVDRYALIVAHDAGFAEARLAGDAAEPPALKLRPWGRIEGTARIGDRPDAGREIRYMSDRNESLGGPTTNVIGTTHADAEGKFAFDRVPPGETILLRGEGPGGRSGGYPIDVIPGETNRVDLGGAGRAVVAKVEVPEGFDPAADYTKFSECSVVSDRPEVPEPPAGTVDADEWRGRWWTSAESKVYRRAYVERHTIKLGPGGALRVDDLPAGAYRLKIEYSAEPIQGRDVDPSKIARLDLPFTVPPIPGGRGGEPLDLGAVRPVVGKRR